MTTAEIMILLERMNPESFYQSQNCPLIEILDELKQDSLELLAIAESGDLEFIFRPNGNRNPAKSLFRYLRQIGWSRTKINRSFKELSKLLLE